jgi:mono/diheme cytochrome c family protein
MPEILRRSARTRAVAALAVAVVCGSLAVAGCGGSDDSSDAPPAGTTAPATTAPATTAPATTAPATTAPTTTAPAAAGDAAQGKTIFAQTCEACHAGLGTRPAVGPKLSGQGLTADFIRTRIIEGKSPMPAGLVQGQDLEDIVAYVKSIQ